MQSAADLGLSLRCPCRLSSELQPDTRTGTWTILDTHLAISPDALQAGQRCSENPSSWHLAAHANRSR